ncbi:MAG: hypothetical protein MUO67_13310 [Anaerolineales bacterium]|nr:hypothetical protein [Anaerolineales bacterium]
MRDLIKRLGLLLILILATLACTLSAPTPVSWVGTPTALALNATQTAFWSTQAAEQTAYPTLPSPNTPTPFVVTPTPISQPLENGPWLIFPTHDGANLLAFDRDTRTLTNISIPLLANLSDLKSGLSPDGSVLLLRAGSIETLNEFGLYRIENPLEPANQITPLLSIYNQRQIINETGSRQPMALRAILEDNAIAWSGNDHQAVFTAALDSDSSDLYLFDLNKTSLERLTARYTQDIFPFWSEDGTWIMFRETDRLDENGTWRFTAMSALRVPRYDETRFLYLPPAGSTGENVLGWLNSVTFVSSTCKADTCSNLRQVSIEDASTTTLYLGHFSDARLSEQNLAIALLIGEADGIRDGKSPGIYLSASEGAAFTQVVAGSYSDLIWSESGKMFLTSGKSGVLGIKVDGNTLLLNNEMRASFAPNGSWLVGWNSSEDNPGLRLYSSSGHLLQSISSIPIRRVIWQPDSKGLYIVGEEGLYQLKFPGLKPVFITDNVYQGADFQYAWLNP